MAKYVELKEPFTFAHFYDGNHNDALAWAESRGKFNKLHYREDTHYFGIVLKREPEGSLLQQIEVGNYLVEAGDTLAQVSKNDFEATHLRVE